MAVVQHARNLSAAITDRFCSPAIWSGRSGFPMTKHLYNPGYYWHWFDDFHNCPLLTTNTADEATYSSYIDTGNTIAAAVDQQNRGVLELTTDATDNDGPVITMQGNIGNSLLLGNTAGDAMPYWMEFRWNKSSITNNQAAIYIGITQEARAVNDGLMADDSGLPADIDHVGWNVVHAEGAELDFVYAKSGAALQVLNDAVATLVAATWYKTGFTYDPAEVAARKGKVFHNNVEQSTYLTTALIDAATFPEDEEMTFSAGLKNGEATAATFRLDWIRLAQEIVPD